jgi:NAD(P)-dependent dehydrogenase (short-subunit alcohol dehydrogenase family)
MDGKTIVATGATSGIGEVAVCDLARRGARIVFVARDPERSAALLQRLKTLAPKPDHRAHLADLSRLSEMKRVATLIAQSERQIDVLINNAGAIFTQRALTADGFELTFATNHLAYFVLTNLLLGPLRATPGARVVSTASGAHKGAKLDFDDLQSEHHFSGMRAYGRSKLMNILFTRELARRLAGSGVTANCLHPGFVATRFGDSGSGAMRFGLSIAKRFALTPEQGARTIIYLASSPEVRDITGQYFYRCQPMTPSTAAQSDEDARRLWDISAKLAALEI